MRAAILAVLLALFFLGAGAGMAARVAIDHYVTAWWYAGENLGYIVSIQEGGEYGPPVVYAYAGYEFVGVPGFFGGSDYYGVWEDGSFRLPLIEGCLPGGICN